jgi:hypothetical protein
LIAGYKVQLLEGTRVYSGGYLQASITPYGFFCDTLSTMPGAFPDVIAKGPEDANLVNHRDDLFFRIYPNPSGGIFTLEMKEAGNSSGISIEITTLMGEMIAKVDMQSGRSYQINLADRQPGIYLVRVMQSDKTGIAKLIRQ